MASKEYVERKMRRAKQAFEDRRPWEVYWQDAAELILPSHAAFTTQYFPGQRRDTRIHDPAAVTTNERFASRLVGTLMGEGQPWFDLRVEGMNGDESRRVRMWLDDVVQIMTTLFNSSSQHFHVAVGELFSQIGAFACGPMFIGTDEETGLPYFQTDALSNVAVWTDNRGRLAGVVRRLEWPAWEIAEKFPDAELPKEVSEAIRSGKPQRKFKVWHVISRREEGDPKDFMNRPVNACYVAGKDEKLLRGPEYFYEFPYVFPRWDHAPGEIYGSGLGLNALPDVKQLQAVTKVTVRGIHKMVDPPWLFDDDGTLQPRAQNRPGGIVYARMNERGYWSAQQMQQTIRTDEGINFIGDLRERIRKHYYLDAFEPPPYLAPDGDVNHMSYAEYADRHRAQLQYIGPVLSRLRSELLVPLIDRVFGILWRADMLPPVPMELQGRRLEAEYVSPLAVAQRSYEGNSVMSFLSKVGAVAQFQPNVMDHINTERTVGVLRRADHVPTEILNSRDERAAIVQARAEQEAQMLNAEEQRDRAEATERNAKAISLIRGA